MAQEIVREIVHKLQSKFFAIMIDETTDATNFKQVVVVIHRVDEDVSAHEDLIGLYKTESITANALVALIKDVLLRCNLSITMCHGHCYDGWSKCNYVWH